MRRPLNDAPLLAFLPAPPQKTDKDEISIAGEKLATWIIVKKPGPEEQVFQVKMNLGPIDSRYG